MINISQNKWLAITLFLICAASLIAYVNELPIMMNYLEVGSFWKTGLLIGSLLGAFCGSLLIRRANDKDGVARLRLFFMVFFFFLLISPLLLSRSNRLFASPATATTVTFESEQARFGSRFGEVKTQAAKPTTHILFFVLDNELYRTSSKTAFFPTATAGDPLSLNIATGYWGYRWVDRSDQ